MPIPLCTPTPHQSVFQLTFKQGDIVTCKSGHVILLPILRTGDKTCNTAHKACVFCVLHIPMLLYCSYRDHLSVPPEWRDLARSVSSACRLFQLTSTVRSCSSCRFQLSYHLLKEPWLSDWIKFSYCMPLWYSMTFTTIIILFMWLTSILHSRSSNRTVSLCLPLFHRLAQCNLHRIDSINAYWVN